MLRNPDLDDALRRLLAEARALAQTARGLSPAGIDIATHNLEDAVDGWERAYEEYLDRQAERDDGNRERGG